MPLRTRTWFIISALCFLVAAIFWQLAERKSARDKAARDAATAATNAPAAPAVPAAAPGTVGATNAAIFATNDPLRFRLSNTAKSPDELSRSDQALLLRNALVDSSLPVNLAIPPHLRSPGDPGSYVVQSRGPLTAAYRAALRQAGAEVVAYVPNNAYLVRASQPTAQQLAALPGTQAVLPWEPYYKLDFDLLELAVEQKPLPTTRMLNVLVFAGEQQTVAQTLATMQAVVVAEDRSPFGVQLVVRPRPDGVVPIAQLPGVQSIETFRPRALANDLARERVRVSTNTFTLQTFQNLTGEGVLVNVNDTGVERLHPDLAGRVTGDSPLTLLDRDGHGTHVAGTIASSGANGPRIPPRQVPGSVSNANFRGMAPGASIYALPLNISGPIIGDTYFQENAAGTNAFISNNSWGYAGSASYDLAAASWDAAVRDSLPGVTGSQPLLAVFAGGNSGDAGIDSPGTAKNVITVGALENMRYITNVVTVIEDGETNTSQPWLGMTDTNNQVAGFSSVGNVGRRREGEFGRFKPDVVAPGTFTVSTRSSSWVQPTNIYSTDTLYIPLVTLRPGESDTFSAFVPRHGWSLEVETFPNQFSRGGVPPINIYIQATTPPVPPASFVDTNRARVGPPIAPRQEIWYFTVENPGDTEARFDIRAYITRTNNVGDEPEKLFNLNQELAPYYRYESGTSMAAPAVSGVLALMQEFFGTRNLSNSPAMMKALVINGARNANDEYDFDVGPDRNLQGWGLINLTNNLPLQNISPQPGDQSFTSDTMVCLDQSVTRALATGQSFTRTVNVAANARTSPLRFTLVWTDPPGNPAVGLKLVNDLDLVVTNLATGAVYVGNAFGPGNIFSPPSPTNNTNGLVLDRVNNVENVYINGSFSQRLTNSYSVTVRAHRVNVNAVTAHPDDVVQDFALVISHGNPRTVTGAAITVTSEPIIETTSVDITTVTNGVPLLNQRVGANSPLIPVPGPFWTNGTLSQWHFFIVTNQLPPSDTNFGNTAAATNIAFATFLPPNLSLTRSNGADIDLYVSLNPALTNLDPNVIATSRRSVRRGGTESVVLTGANDAVPGAIYYAGVKSEDQQAANFGFFAISSSSPFSQSDSNGTVYVTGFPFNVEIPDGSPSEPQAGFMFAFCLDQITIQNVVVTNFITHENGGDLFGALDLQGDRSSVLNANRGFSGLVEYRYDDSGSGEHLPTDVTDAPGSLRNFVGEEGQGQWRLTMVDSAPGATGQVNSLDIRLDPVSEDLLNGEGVVATILPGAWFRTVVDVPPDATNLLVCVAQDEGPLIVHIARGYDPDLFNFDLSGIVMPPGDCLSLGRRDVPPLSAGRYFIGVFNPSTTMAVNARISVFIQRDLAARATAAFRSDFGKALLDDAKTNSTIFVGRRGVIADINVGVRIAHPRVSDLVLHLVSPEGTRLLLAENRGGPLGADYGAGALVTNVAPTTSAGDAQASTNTIGLKDTEGVLQVDYEFFGVPDRMTVYYEDNLIFDSGLISGSASFSIDYGPGVSTNLVIVMNEGTNPNAGTLWTYTAKVVSGYVFTTFTDDTNLTLTPVKYGLAPFTNGGFCVSGVSTQRQVVYFNDFQGSVSQEWSLAQTTVAPRGGGFLGRFSNQSVSFLQGGLPPHDELEVSFDLFIIDSWDGNGHPGYTADLWDWHFEGSNVVHATFGNFPGLLRQAYPGTYPGGDYVSQVGATRVNTLGYTADSTYRITRSFPHRGATAQMSFSNSSASPQPINDESWGIDNVEIATLSMKTNTPSCNYYLPEEPITQKPFGKLVGENAYGEWALEIWDNRVGAGITNSLLAWKLNITFVNTNPPTVTLTNGLAYCGTLRQNETAYFLVNAPISAGAATNLITASQDVTLSYSAMGLPTGQEPPDTVFFADEPGGKAIIDGGGWNSFDLGSPPQFLGGSFTPQLRPGRRYYLAVQNRFQGTNAFCVQVNFDDASGTLVPITHINPTNNNGCVFGFVDASGVSYYSFDLGTNAIGAEFTVSNISGAADLYVKRGLPVPRTDLFFAKSDNPGATAEFIQVADFTGTRLPGRWYLAVVGTAGSTFDICAREITGPVIPLLVNTTNCNNTVATNSAQYYRVVISSNAFLADFRTFAVNNVDLYISTNEMLPLLKSPTNALFASTNAPSGNELIRLSVFDTNMFLTPGTWYLGVVNRTAAPVNYCVAVNQITTNIDYITLVSGVPYMRATNGIGYYRFDVSPNALQAVFETFGATNDVDLYIRSGFPLPPPGTNFFDFASATTPTGTEWIGLVAGDTNRLLRPGTSYWIAVVPKNTNVISSYKVRATQILRSEVTRLFSGIDACAVVQPVDTNALHSGAQFYQLDVGPYAVQALIETFNASGNVDLYLQYGLPITNYTLLRPPSTGNFIGRETPGGNETICLRTNDAPIFLRPGTWYLTVVNRETNDVSYCIGASVLEVVPLADGVTQCGALNVADGSTANGIRYYSFTVAANAVQVDFETFSATGNVDLYLKRPVGPFDCSTFPGDLATFPAASTNSGAQPEIICLISNSPVQLAAGEWLVAVVNRETNSFAGYCVRASQLLDTDFVRVTNGVSYCPTVGVGNGSLSAGIDYYIVTVTNDPVLVTLETFNATGNVDLYVGQVGGSFCVPNFAAFDSTLTNYPYASENMGTAAECVTLGTNTAPVVLTNGEWYVAVVNRDPIDVSYCFAATQFTNDPNVRLTNNVALCGETVSPTNAVGTVGVNHYVVTISSNALQATFEVFSADGNVDLYLQNGFCFQNRDTFSLGTENAAYASTNAGTAAESITVHTGSFPVALQPGEWHLAVVSRETNNVTFCVRVTEWLESDVVRLTNATPYSASVEGQGSPAGLPVDYYVFNVSSNAVRAQFEVLSPSGDVNLVARRGLPLPSLADHHYASTNAGVSDELIVVLNSSTPIALTPGDWYLAVLNTTSNAVSYTVVATEYASTGTNFGVGAITIVSNNLFCLTWTNLLPGASYHVQGKADLNAAAWLPVSPTLKPAGTTLTWCVQLPSPYHFFRLVEGQSPSSSGNPMTFTGISLGTNGMTISWTAPANQRYGVEWTDTLFPPAWKPYPDYVTSVTTSYTFIDDGSKTGSLPVNRYYRFFLMP